MTFFFGTFIEPKSPAYKGHPKENTKYIRWIFIVFFILELLITFEGGAIPAGLQSLSKDFGLSASWEGALGGSPYVGITLTAPFVGRLYKRYGHRKIILLSIFSNLVFNIMMTISLNKWMLVSSRLLQGFSQAPFIIYAPVWIDEFAPNHRTTLWLGLFQGATIVGVTIGYLSTGFCVAYGVTWRISFVVQNIIQASFVLAALTFPSVLLSSPISSGTKAENNKRLSIKTSSKQESIQEPGRDDASTEMQDNSQVIDTDRLAAITGLETYDGDNVLRIELPSEQMDSNTDCQIPSITQEIWKQSLESNDFSGLVCHKDEIEVKEKDNDNTENVEGNICPSFWNCTEDPANRCWLGLENRNYNQNICPMKVTEHDAEANSDSPLPISKGLQCQNLSTRASLSTPSSLGVLLRTPLYVFLVLTLSTLLFVVTGIQFWSTRYFLTVMEVEPWLAMISFSMIAASGPTVGVLISGSVVDYLGGYKTRSGVHRTLNLCTGWAILAITCAMLAAFLKNWACVAVSIWGILLFGGMIVPPTTGILIVSVSEDIRPQASAYAMLAYNVLGYAAGAALPGFIMEIANGAADLGMKVVLFWSINGLVFILCAKCWLIIKERRERVA